MENIHLKILFLTKVWRLQEWPAHITYLSKKGLQEKIGRKLQERDDLKFGFDAGFSNRKLFKISRLLYL
jgi:hypothetical protein